MKFIYVLNVQMTGCDGNVNHFVESAFTDFEVAIKQENIMTETFKDDPNYMSYITGPILLNEEKRPG